MQDNSLTIFFVNSSPQIPLMELNPNPTPEAAIRRQFKVNALPCIDPALEDRWEWSIGIQAPQFQRATKVHPGQSFQLLVLLMGYGTDPHMHANVDFAWTLKDGSGKKVAGAAKLDGIKGRVLHGDFILRPRVGIQVKIPKKAPFGTYTVEVKAKCHVSKQQSTSQIDIEYQALDWEGTFSSQEEVAQWMEKYAQVPSPEHLPQAYRIAFQTLGREQPDSFFVALAFFGEVLRMNPWLGAEIESRWPHMPAVDQSAFALLLHAARYSAQLPALKSLLDERMKVPFPSGVDLVAHSVSHPQELDFLWAIYRANGRYATFRRICTAVAPLPEALAAVTPQETQDALVQAAAWSIDQHIQHHPDAMMYSMALFKEHDLDPRVYMLLEELLRKRNWIPNNDYA